LLEKNIKLKNNVFEIEVPIKKYKQLIFVFGVASIFFTYMILTSFYNAIIGKIKIELNSETISYFILYVILINIAMWFIFGYEKLIITDDLLISTKSNKLFNIKRKYKLKNIQSANLINKTYKPQSFSEKRVERIKEKQKALFFWTYMGKIELKLKYFTKTILNGISDNEAKEIVILINDAIKKQKNKSN